MRFTRIIAGTVTAGLVGLLPVAIGSPATATANLTTASTLTTSSTLPLTYGSYATLSPDVVASDGGSAYYGTVTLMVSTPRVPAWTAVATHTTTYESFDVRPTLNSAYKIVYSGYTATNAYEDTYAASESPVLGVGVTYKLKAKTPGTSIVGKIKPSYKKKKVIIQRKVGKAYKKYRTVRTNARSAFRVKLPTGAPGKKVFFRVIVKGTSEITSLAAGFYTIRY